MTLGHSAGEVGRLLHEGLTVTEVSRHLHLSHQRVAQLRTKLGLPTKTAARRARVQRASNSGRSIAAIAEDLGLSYDSVMRDKKVLGISAADERAIRRERVNDLIKQGLADQDIAKRMGIRKRMVSEDRIEAGVRRRSSPAGLVERRSMVARLTLEGRNVQEIAGVLGVTPAVIVLDQRFLKMHAPRRFSPAHVAERRSMVARLTLEGRNVQEIAGVLGVVPHTVWNDRKWLKLDAATAQFDM